MRGTPGEGITWWGMHWKEPWALLWDFLFATKLHPFCWVLSLLHASGGGRKWQPPLLLSIVLLTTFSSLQKSGRCCHPFSSFPKEADVPVSNQGQSRDPGLPVITLWVRIGVMLPHMHYDRQNSWYALQVCQINPEQRAFIVLEPDSPLPHCTSPEESTPLKMRVTCAWHAAAWIMSLKFNTQSC